MVLPENMIKYVTAALLVLFGFHATLCVAQNTISVDWSVTDNDEATASVGDIVKFDWDDTHNVYIHPTGSCDETGAIFIGEQPGASYTFTAEDAGSDIYFACDVGQHCEFGQFIKFTVSDGSEPTPSPVSTPSPVTAAPPTSTTDAPVTAPTDGSSAAKHGLKMLSLGLLPGLLVGFALNK